MTATTDTTTRDIEEMCAHEGATLDLQGVQATLQLLAWAEESLPYECIGETRRLALMLLERSMDRALRALDMNNLEMERDKAVAAKLETPQPKPKAAPQSCSPDRASTFPSPTQGGRDISTDLTAIDVLSEFEGDLAGNLPASAEALCSLMDAQYQEMRGLLKLHGLDASAIEMFEPAIWASGMLLAMARDLKRKWNALHKRAASAA